VDERPRPILGKLRDSEYGMDVARASLVLERPDERHRLRQSGVGDGHLIEWKGRARHRYARRTISRGGSGNG